MSAPRYVLDSCVFIKLFLEEPDSAQARRFIADTLQAGGSFVVPELFTYEVLQVARNSGADFDAVLDILINRRDSNGIEIITPSRQHWLKAQALSREGHAKSGFPSLYDSIYHAIALVEGIDFVTADARHIAKTKNQGAVKLLGGL